MKLLIKIDIPIIVEGKYDKITLENVVDALIIQTNGFAIFHDKEKCDMIRKLSENGIIIMTDSDSAGALIRAHLKNIIANDKIINVYVPYLKGKEKRKNAPGKEGILGVEGMEKSVLEEALLKSGVALSENSRPKITKNDFFILGLSGSENAGEKRKQVLEKMGLPLNLSSSAMLDVVNNLYSFEEFSEFLKSI